MLEWVENFQHETVIKAENLNYSASSFIAISVIAFADCNESRSGWDEKLRNVEVSWVICIFVITR